MQHDALEQCIGAEGLQRVEVVDDHEQPKLAPGDDLRKLDNVPRQASALPEDPVDFLAGKPVVQRIALT